MWRERIWKRQQKKEHTVDRERAEELQAAQQPAAGEKGSDVPHLPAGLGSGILENISAETPEKMRTPLHEDFQSTEVVPETSRDLTDYLQNQIEAEAKAEAIKLLDEEEAHNNQPLGDKMLEMMVMNGEAQVIKDLVLTDLQDLQNDNLKDMNSADTEAEAIKQQMQIHGDEPGTPNDQPLGNVEKKSDAEPDWMLDYEPIKSWADFIEENEETIDDIAEIEAWKNDLPVNHQEDENTERETSGMSERITYEGHQEERKSEADEEENVIRISEHRGIRVGAVEDVAETYDDVITADQSSAVETEDVTDNYDDAVTAGPNSNIMMDTPESCDEAVTIGPNIMRMDTPENVDDTITAGQDVGGVKDYDDLEEKPQTEKNHVTESSQPVSFLRKLHSNLFRRKK
ncbi:hypothetical protein AOLI_G00312240 [Acnodon oligacanthus]